MVRVVRMGNNIKMRKVVIVNQSSGYLTTEIANAFVDSGKYDSEY